MSDEDDFCTCEVCGTKVLYGSRHHQCGTYALSKDAEIAALKERLNECVGGTKRDLSMKLQQQRDKTSRFVQQLDALKEQNAELQQSLADALLQVQGLRSALVPAYEKLKIECSGYREYKGGLPTQILFSLIEDILSSKSGVAGDEREKVVRDAMLYGQGFMVDGKHVPLQDIWIIPPAISAQCPLTQTEEND